MGTNIEKIEATCFSTESLTCKDREFYFHRYLEIYRVVKGNAFASVSGDNRLLSQGQMVIVNPFENHSCEAVGEAQVQVICIGTDYLDLFFTAYPGKRLPRWLTDPQANSVILEYIEKNFPKESISELHKNRLVCQLFSIVTEGYGLVEQRDISKRDKVLITEMIQYIYDHCSENITLETLSKVFYLSPSILSKKLRKQICVDFRVFVNDIRIHKAVRMMEASENRKKKIEDIAILCGFNSMSTFYRCYKRNYSFRRMRAVEENVEL